MIKKLALALHSAGISAEREALDAASIAEAIDAADKRLAAGRKPAKCRAKAKKSLWPGITLGVTCASVLCADVPSEDAKKQIHLVWQTGPKGLWEGQWIREQLTDFEVIEVVDGNYSIYLDQSVVVVGNYSGDYFYKLAESNCQFGIIHISDEHCTFATHYYDVCPFVFRNYWHKKFRGKDNVHFFPLGYKNGLWSPDLEGKIGTALEREYTWSFAGTIIDHPTRRLMVENMKLFPDYFFYETATFGDPRSMSTQDYRDLLLQTVFVPCARGYWNLDSFRVYEALECGCIPIVEKKPFDYFTRQLGSYPFLSVESWDEAPALVDALLQDPTRLEELRQECHLWWIDYKKKTKKAFKDVIEEAFFCPTKPDFEELLYAK